MNTTFTNYAEKKAKQILNLLQGYTKGIRLTTILILLLMGVSNAWADTGFEDNSSTNGIKYYKEGDGADKSWGISRTNQAALDLNDVTGLYLKEFYVHMYQNTDNINGNVKMYYQIKRQSEADGSYTLYIQNNWSYWLVDTQDNNGWKDDWRHPKFGCNSINNGNGINLLDGLGSGKYSLRFYMYEEGSKSYLSNNSANYTVNWTYNIVPSVNNFKVTASNVVSGTGTSENPYVIAYGKTTTLTVSGNKASTDANSSLYAKFGNNNYSSTLTKDLTPNSNTQSIQVKAKYYNSKDDLSGAETTTQTIYYRSEQVYTVTFNANGHGTAPAAQTVSQGSKATKPADLTATGYTFGGWYREAGCTNAFDFNTAINADITLYAKWTPVPTLEISTNQQYLRTGKDKLQLTINHENIPENSKYRVHCTTTNGYYPNSSGLDNIDISGSGTINYTSQSSLGLGKLKFVVEIYNSNNLIITSNEIQVTVQQDWEVAVYKKIDNIETLIRNISPTENIGVEVTAEVVTGYAFTGWTANTINITFEDASALSTLVYAKSGGVIYANYTKMYDVQVSVAAGQESWGSVSTSSINVGSVSSEQITATANTNLGYVFDHWKLSDGITITSGNANSATIQVKATKAGSLTAHFRGENRLQNVYLIGTMNNDKESDANWQFYKLPGESGNTVTLTKTINKSDFHSVGYKFGIKIFHSDWNSKYWKNSSEGAYKMDAHNCTNGWEFNTDGGNFNTFIDLNVSGEYTFTLTDAHASDKQKLSITYPDKSFIEGNFATAWDENAYPLTENGDIQTVTIPITSKEDVEFRLVSHGKLFGSNTKILVASNSQTLSPKNMEDQGAVMTIGAYVEGDYVFSYNKSTKVLTVTYPSVNQLQVYSANPAHDAAKKNWDWDSQNGNEYTKTLSLNANTTYTFKAVVNSDFYGKTATLTRKDPSSTLSTEGDDVTIKTDIAGNYTFTFNTSTKNLSVTYPGAYTFTYGIEANKNLGTVAVTPNIASGTLVAAGTEITITPTPNLGYKFEGWYDEPTCKNQINTTNPYTFDLTTNTTLYAKFVLRNLYIHADFVNWEGRLVEPEFKDNSVVYTYTGILEKKESSYNNEHTIWDGGHHFHYLYSLEGIEKPETQKIAYNYNNVDAENISYTQDLIDAVHLTDDNNPTIQFGLTKKSRVTITLTLVSDIETDDKATQPDVAIVAIPCNTITLDQTGARTQGTVTSVEVPNGDPMPAITGDGALPTPQIGYTFMGYFDQKDGKGTQYYNANGTSEYTWDKTEDATLYAHWIPTEYNITYELNGGTNHASNPKTYNITQEITLQDPTYMGHTFAGWYDNAELTGEAVTQIKTGSTGDKAYWAKWDVASYTITFDTKEGTGGPSTLTVRYGVQLPNITIPTNAGHLFLGYYDGTGTQYYDANGKGLKTMPANNITLYAKWIPYSQCIFFKNNLKWNNVYVYTFSADTWDSYVGVKVKGKYIEYGKMTQIGQTDVYYYTLTNTTTGFSHIAFSETDMHNNNEFYGSKAIYRGDRSDQMPLFIPQTDQTASTTNTTKYYSSGIWMKYNSTESGYDWRGATDKNNQEQWSKKYDFTASKPGGYSFTATVEFDNTSTHYFKIHNTKGDWFGNGGTMTQNNCTNWIFGSDNSNNAKITPTITGTYIFTIYLGDGEVSVSLDYPLSTGDYRLVYVDDVTGAHPGHYIKKRNEERLDTVSFFVHSQNSPRIWLQHCTKIDQNGNATWATDKEYEVLKTAGAHPSTAQLPGKRKSDAVLHVGEGCGIEESGVYNFILQQYENNQEADLATDATHKYEGNFYIRTDAAEGGWDSFRQKSNEITYSSFADSHSNFNHYFCKYIEAGRNVKFTIANDYSYCISDTLDNDEIIKKGQSSNGCLPINANVRFGWDSNTNEISRAYIKGAGMTSDRFLVLQGKDENLKDANGNVIPKGTGTRTGLEANEEILVDQQNWIYQVEVTANKDTKVKLIAEYNGTTQYFKGNEKEYTGLLSSTTANSYKIRLVYDFKSNNLVAAMVLDGNKEVEKDDALGTDMMVIRRNQGHAEQLTFNPDSKKLTEVGTVYAVMTFTSEWINGTAKARERSLYWVSFPFDVKVSDVFGFGEYGEEWILQYYDGAERAEKGLFGDSGTYWKYIEDTKTTLNAGTGYVLALDLSKVKFLHGATEVSLYFPSTKPLTTISGKLPTAATVPAHECTIDREWTEGGTKYHHKYTDSHWNLIGVPGFADIDFYLAKTGYHFMQNDASFYYNFKLAESTYAVEASQVTEFQAMYAYMVQFAGTINWTSSEVSGVARPELVAPRNSDAEPEKVVLRLELAQGEEEEDHTFVQLQQEGATANFDLSLDLTKIMNSCFSNIYTLTDSLKIQVAGNALPMEETVVPVGVNIAAAGEYTFRMPDGTEGMVVELVDYETNTRTNLLLSDYIVTLPKGTSENRFALHIQPQKDVVTSLENIGEGVNNGEAVNKYLIDGKLIIRTAEGVVYDAQGHRL